MKRTNQEREMADAETMMEAYYKQYAGTLEKEEYMGNVRLAYWEAHTTYPRYAGCCDWEEYLQLRIREEIERMKRMRARQLTVESRLSLDQHVGDSRESVGEWIHRPQGDFTRGVDLQDFLQRLDAEEQALALGYCRADTDRDLLRSLGWSPVELREQKRRLRHHMQEYLAI